jgi:heat shock protein HtpX
LEGKQKMISALERLQKSVNQPHLPEQLEAFGISGGMAAGLKSLFMSHPPLADRIEALRKA